MLWFHELKVNKGISTHISQHPTTNSSSNSNSSSSSSSSNSTNKRINNSNNTSSKIPISSSNSNRNLNPNSNRYLVLSTRTKFLLASICSPLFSLKARLSLLNLFLSTK